MTRVAVLISRFTFVSYFFRFRFYLSLIFFFYQIISILLPITHDRQVIWTYLMFKSRVSRASPTLFRTIYFIYLFVVVTSNFYGIINLIKI